MKFTCVRIYSQYPVSIFFMTSSVYVSKFSGLLPPSATSVLIHTTLFCGPNFDVQIRNQVPRNLATDLAASPHSTENTTTDLKSHQRHDLRKLVLCVLCVRGSLLPKV